MELGSSEEFSEVAPVRVVLVLQLRVREAPSLLFGVLKKHRQVQENSWKRWDDLGARPDVPKYAERSSACGRAPRDSGKARRSPEPRQHSWQHPVLRSQGAGAALWVFFMIGSNVFPRPICFPFYTGLCFFA